jgi:hypothetical protein
MINDCPSMIMPFCFQVLQREDMSLYFEFDLKLWSYAEGMTNQLDPENCLRKLQCQIDVLSNKPTPQKAARRAIHKMATKGYLHEDLDWRHVALRPIIDTLLQDSNQFSLI